MESILIRVAKRLFKNGPAVLTTAASVLTCLMTLVFANCSDFQSMLNNKNGGTGQDNSIGSGRGGIATAPQDANQAPVLTLTSQPTQVVVRGIAGFDTATVSWRANDPDNDLQTLTYKFDGITNLDVTALPFAGDDLSIPNTHKTSDPNAVFTAAFRIPEEIVDDFAITLTVTDPFGASTAVQIQVDIQSCSQFDSQPPRITLDPVAPLTFRQKGQAADFLFEGGQIRLKFSISDNLQTNMQVKISVNKQGTDVFDLVPQTGYSINQTVTVTSNALSLNVPNTLTADDLETDLSIHFQVTDLCQTTNAYTGTFQIGDDIDGPAITPSLQSRTQNCMGGPAQDFFIGETLAFASSTEDTYTATGDIKRSASITETASAGAPTDRELFKTVLNATNPYSRSFTLTRSLFGGYDLSLFHNLFFKADDLGGNTATTTLPFSISPDPSAPTVSSVLIKRVDRLGTESVPDAGNKVFPGDRLRFQYTFNDIPAGGVSNCTQLGNITHNLTITNVTYNTNFWSSTSPINRTFLVNHTMTQNQDIAGNLNFTVTDLSSNATTFSPTSVSFGTDSAKPTIAGLVSNISSGQTILINYASLAVTSATCGDDYSRNEDITVKTLTFVPTAGAPIAIQDFTSTACTSTSFSYPIRSSRFPNDSYDGYFEITYQDVAHNVSDPVKIPSSGTVHLQRDNTGPVISEFLCPTNTFTMYSANPQPLHFSWTASDNSGATPLVTRLEITDTDPSKNFAHRKIDNPSGEAISQIDWNPGSTDFNRDPFPAAFGLHATLTLRDGNNNITQIDCTNVPEIAVEPLDDATPPQNLTVTPADGSARFVGQPLSIAVSLQENETAANWIRYRFSYSLNGATFVKMHAEEWRTPARGQTLPFAWTVPSSFFGQLTLKVEAAASGGTLNAPTAIGTKEVHVRIKNPNTEQTVTTYLDLNRDGQINEDTGIPFDISCNGDLRPTSLLRAPDGILVFSTAASAHAVCGNYLVNFSAAYDVIDEGSPLYNNLMVWIDGGTYDAGGNWIPSGVRGSLDEGELYPLNHVPFFDGGRAVFKRITYMRFQSNMQLTVVAQ